MKKLNKQKIARFIVTVLFLIMVALIYIVSPKITASIQNFAKFIYDLDSNYITRVVELVLAISLVGAVASVTNKKGEK